MENDRVKTVPNSSSRVYHIIKRFGRITVTFISHCVRHGPSLSDTPPPYAIIPQRKNNRHLHKTTNT